MNLDISQDSFINVRVTMQRLEDAKFFNGWVASFVGREIAIKMLNVDGIEPGMMFQVTANGADATASFSAMSHTKYYDEVVFYISGQVQYSKPLEEVRFAVNDIVGTIGLNGISEEILVADISRSGFGGTCSVQFPRDTEIDFQIETIHGPISGRGEIRYCRQDPKDVTRSRFGVLIKSLGRIETARWRSLLGSETSNTF